MVNALQSYFHKGTEKQNSSHWINYCKGCVKHEKKLLQDAGTFDAVDWQEGGQSFREACQRTVSVRGDKITWITHILGGRNAKACIHVTDAARQEATSQRDAGFAEKQKTKAAAAETSRNTATVFGTSTTSESAGKHGRSVSAADDPEPKRLKQGFFQVFSGKDQPFTTAEAAEFQAQALRATVSAGLPFRVWENREVQKLIGLLRSAGPEILPSRKVVAGRLLDNAAEKVEVQVKRALQGKEAGLVSDGWKARKKIDVNALCANVDYKVYTLELVDMTALSKDGPALCKQFADMIDRVEAKYKCYIIFFTTDADGGSKKGRTLLGKERPWLFVPSCWAHQFQLILGDYFKVYPYAAEIAETATGLIAWINNHGKVRKIFDAVQAELSKDRLGHVLVLAYLVANLTRWTTHCIAFLRLLVLREYLQFAVMQSRGAIIAAQVGAAKSTEAERLKEEAIHYCDLISNPAFWSGLTSVVEDIEPICYGTNINQKDNTRADQVLLTLAGLYLHYTEHPEPEISVGLVSRLEKRWKDCDQPLFLVALILNPFEGLSCFGPAAKFDHFKATSLVTDLYRRVMNYPGNNESPQQRVANERSVSQLMFEYLSCTGSFQGWADARDEFEETNGKDPIRVWTALAQSTGELSRFAVMILKVVVNQAGCERVFSDVGNIESPRRSRTALAKLEKITKINAGIKAEHLAEGFAPAHRGRKNHESVEKLLAVPRYRDLLDDQEDEDESERGRALVSSSAGWRTEMAKWISDVRAAEAAEQADDSDSDDDTPIPGSSTASTSRLPRPKSRKWVKTTLAVLFGGASKPVRKFTNDDIDQEAALMEALAEAEEDARPDDGAVECSDDEYMP